MYRHKLLHSRVRTDNARRLQQLLLDYHDFRNQQAASPQQPALEALRTWQSERLKSSHRDLYEDPRYRDGLDFLLADLYAPTQFTRRDDDVDRVFPVMVKLLPDSVLYTVAELVELNLLSQRLDLQLTETWSELGQPLDEASYCEAFRRCDNRAERLRQIQLVANIGNDLDRYVHSRTISFALSLTEGAAEMAGLGELHGFLRRGFAAFRAMESVDSLLDQIVERETDILEGILQGRPAPFSVRLDQPFSIR
ncbi:FFLEELY motif protein [Mangrovitalea sediminis]|uniref:FFLEELY motif protein n=1 Tax=Mangrovitalea sediminis TaxID=1982043 RepID=UPI000BE4C28D|nr:hypothetical protein [Mangrovitalea sediminis]